MLNPVNSSCLTGPLGPIEGLLETIGSRGAGWIDWGAWATRTNRL